MPDRELAAVKFKEIKKLEKKATKMALIGHFYLKIPRNMMNRFLKDDLLLCIIFCNLLFAVFCKTCFLITLL